MALDDSDREEIAGLIADAIKTKPSSPTGSRRPAPAAPEGDWGHLPPRDQESFMRRIVEEELAKQDAAWERENLLRENEELKAKIKEWEKQGRPGRRPTRADLAGGKPEEGPPTVVNRVYRFMFGDAAATK